MNVGVFLHVTLLVEALAAVLAGVGPCVGVYQEVCRQRRRSLETLPALLTREHFLCTVYSPVWGDRVAWLHYRGNSSMGTVAWVQ